MPVKSRLQSKGVNLSLDCPMCNSGDEDLIHIFFTCQFAMLCWQYSGMVFDLSLVEFAPSWLLARFESGPDHETFNIARVLWGIWFFRNKKVWDHKVVTAAIAMDWSAKIISDWKEAKAKRVVQVGSTSSSASSSRVKWKKLTDGVLKLNVDAGVRFGEASVSLGLVLHDSEGVFVMGKTICKAMVATVLEAEASAIFEGGVGPVSHHQ